jgi:metal-responsive CopG/Arc/MetJ family transcriptional regulator
MYYKLHKEGNMSPETIRLNITLPASLAEQLKNMSGPRKQSQFVAKAVEQRINQLKKEQLRKTLTDGYKTTSTEGRKITEDFNSADLEGWDDY